jgi:hypothetical protein
MTLAPGLCHKAFMAVINSYVPDVYFQPSLSFEGKTESGVYLGRLQPFLVSIRQGWKRLTVTNNLAY